MKKATWGFQMRTWNNPEMVSRCVPWVPWKSIVSGFPRCPVPRLQSIRFCRRWRRCPAGLRFLVFRGRYREAAGVTNGFQWEYAQNKMGAYTSIWLGKGDGRCYRCSCCWWWNMAAMRIFREKGIGVRLSRTTATVGVLYGNFGHVSQKTWAWFPRWI
jgi:hypothetical protein